MLVFLVEGMITPHFASLSDEIGEVTTLKVGTDLRCQCGRVHPPVNTQMLIYRGARAELSVLVRGAGARRVLAIYDTVTSKLFGEPVQAALDDRRNPAIQVSQLVLGSPNEPLEVDEQVVSLARRAIEDGVDYIIGVGTGAINDLGKY